MLLAGAHISPGIGLPRTASENRAARGRLTGPTIDLAATGRPMTGHSDLCGPAYRRSPL